jgi:hypothetical protein
MEEIRDTFFIFGMSFARAFLCLASFRGLQITALPIRKKERETLLCCESKIRNDFSFLIRRASGLSEGV